MTEQPEEKKVRWYERIFARLALWVLYLGVAALAYYMVHNLFGLI